MKKENLEDIIKKVSHLSKLAMSEDDLGDYLKKAKSIISYVEQLNELNTDNVEPMSHAFDVKGSLREDAVTDSKTAEKILKNAPEADGNLFAVPRVIEES